MKKIRKKAEHFFIQYLILTLASGLYGVGISLFLDPNKIAPGGISGIAIMINHTFGLSTGMVTFLINIPILLVGLYKLGFNVIISTVYTTIISSVWMDVLATLPPLSKNLMLSSIAGGFLVAISLGIIFKNGATTGGTDIIVKIIKLKYKHLKTGGIFLGFDAVVVGLSIIVFKDVDAGLYAAISCIVTAKVLDMVLYGSDGAKLMYIISDKSDIIASRILQELDIGATFINGNGAYRGTEQKIIMCTTKKSYGPKVKQIVQEVDDHAFMIISSASDVFGIGFKNYHSEEL